MDVLSDSSVSSDEEDEGEEEDQLESGLSPTQIAALRDAQEKKRKARNQRRYYRRHKGERQEKARVRAAK